MSSHLSHNLILETALSVDGITDYIKELLEEDANLTQVWVYGEVSSASPHSKGLFFTLQDSNGTTSIRCVVWGNLVKELVQMPKKGEQVLVLGSLTLYRQRGEYQLRVFQALPAGEGLQALRYQQLRNRLQAEGLFDRQRKRSLPPSPNYRGCHFAASRCLGRYSKDSPATLPWCTGVVVSGDRARGTSTRFDCSCDRTGRKRQSGTGNNFGAGWWFS